jgi:hypothetical protein
MKLGLREARRPVAVCEPIKEADTEQTALQQMADEGLITLPSRKGPMPSARWKPVKVKGKSLSRTIIEDRTRRPRRA